MFYWYPIVSWLYLAIPLLTVGAALYASLRLRRNRPLRKVLRACTLGAMLGGMVALLYASLTNTHVPLAQVLLGSYLGASVLCIISGLNGLLYRGVSWLFRIEVQTGQGGCCAGAQALAGVVQALLLIGIGLPYLGSVLVLYRPKAPSAGDPISLIEAPFETIRFPAVDGTPLEAWWIPAARNRYTDGRGSPKGDRDTVMLCHGFGADKASDLFLARDLVANGYNVLAVDLRAHGRSGGQFTGFGGVEGRDVLGAVRWLRANRGGHCDRILGLGEGLGAVALIEAAADPGLDGQAIDAIAAYNPYDDLDAVLHEVVQTRAIRPAQWTFAHAILPLASAQLGADLRRVLPERAVQQLWPRPLLVIGDPLSRDAARGRSFDVFQRALQPKYGYWRSDLAPDALLHDHTAALTVRIFFDEERSIL